MSVGRETNVTSIHGGRPCAVIAAQGGLRPAYEAGAQRLSLWREFLLTIAALAVVAAVLTPAASAGVSRPFEGTLGGSFFDSGPTALAVDQETGDVYAGGLDGNKVLARFTAAGAPKDFTAGLDAGTNALTGWSSGFGDLSIAVDNSGGPLDGSIYVADLPDASSAMVKVFDRDGSLKGTLDGSDTGKGDFGRVCGIAVDQANGDVYLATSYLKEGVISGRIWRYRPGTVAAPVNDDDYEVTGIGTAPSCSVAAQAGRVYAAGTLKSDGGRLLREFSSADFQPTISDGTEGTVLDTGVAGLAVDPATGQVYVLHNRAPAGGSQPIDGSLDISVLDPGGELLYKFGAGGYYGTEPKAIAVKAATSGPASDVYVANPQAGGRDIVHFGLPENVPVYTHLPVTRFGPDGTSDTLFSTGLFQFAFEHTARKLYALDRSLAAIYGFDASAPPSFPLLPGFQPLGGMSNFGAVNDLAVDSSGLASAGNVYRAASSGGVVYGFDADGSPLPGFPLNPPAVFQGPDDPAPVKFVCGVAVDSEGQLLVSERESDRILRYDASGKLLGWIDVSAQTTSVRFSGPCELTLDSDDNLYVGIEASAIWRYSAASGWAAADKITTGLGFGDLFLAYDNLTDHLLVGSGEGYARVDEYDTNGKLVDEFVPGYPYLGGVEVDPVDGFLYLGDRLVGRQIKVYRPPVLLPEAKLASLSSIENASVTAKGTVGAQAIAVSDCHFEYVTEAAYRVTGFGDLSSGGTVPCSPDAGSIPLDLATHPVSASITGLTRNTDYRLRLVASNADGVTESSDLAFTTAGPPEAETTGSPQRTATTALLEGRVNPRGAETTYHFEYGPTNSYGQSTAEVSAGSGSLVRLVAEPVGGLAAGSTYHYRLVADNGNSDGVSFGADRTITTRASDASPTPPAHPGPPDSDRAWEQVSLGETSGNPVGVGLTFSDAGDEALYGIKGGTPLAESGALGSLYFAERTGSGWSTRNLLPPATQFVGSTWGAWGVSDDFSKVLAANVDLVLSGSYAYWSLNTSGLRSPLFKSTPPQTFREGAALSADGSRTIVAMRDGALDPAYPGAASKFNLYDISSGSPKLVSVLPGGNAPGCGLGADSGGANRHAAFSSLPPLRSHWVSADGSRVFFTTSADDCLALPQLYLRNLAAGQTTLVSGPSVSGPVCGDLFLKQTPGAAFFWTESRLVAEDEAEGGCATEIPGKGGDVYRFDLESGALDCLTCLVPGLPADVKIASRLAETIAVADDGSRLYFTSPHRLLPGAAPNGSYRLDLAGEDPGIGQLAYVGRLPVGEDPAVGMAINPDGSVLFSYGSEPSLNPLGGSNNGGTKQFYRYDDRDRSLTCISCPQGGSPPVHDIGIKVVESTTFRPAPLSVDGQTLAFATPEPLLPADLNTASGGQKPEQGNDVYEWRDGRVSLVTDGATTWSSNQGGGADETEDPVVAGVSTSGRDIFFTATAAYTPDAPDTYRRLYDARIGGGFDFPEPPPPCPLELCQGPPSPTPEDPDSASSGHVGPGNAVPVFPKRKPCHKPKVRRHGRCVKPRHHKTKKQHKSKHRNHHKQGATAGPKGGN